MPWAPRQHCSIPGCSGWGPGPCDRHRAIQQRRIDQARGTPAQRGYDHSWAERARRFLERYPVCCVCGGDATVPNHRIRRTMLVAIGVKDPDADEYLEPMCASCHGRFTAKNEGRWGGAPPAAVDT